MKSKKPSGGSRAEWNPAQTNLFPPRFIFHGNAVAAEVIINRVGQDRTRQSQSGARSKLAAGYRQDIRNLW